jgi:hypothetical protein
MARRKQTGPQLDIRLVAKEIGMELTLAQAIEAMGVEAFAAVLENPQKLYQNLSAAKRRQLDEVFERMARKNKEKK